MGVFRSSYILISAVIMALLSCPACADSSVSARSEKAVSSWMPKLEAALKTKKLSLGAPVFSVFSKLKTERLGEASYKPLLKIRLGVSSFSNLGIFVPILARLAQS